MDDREGAPERLGARGDVREAQVATPMVLRHSPRDALLVALAAGHGALLLTVPSAPLLALAFWWTANTVAHNFIHLPFFRARSANAAFSGYLSLLLGLPQTLWRDRHLAHHAGRRWRLRWSRQLAIEFVVVAALWVAVASRGPQYFLETWTAGWLGGLLLCWMQGHYEHVRGTVSHYGRAYNLAFFNDGYHVEHHARPGLHWSALPAAVAPGAERSRWPAVLRWLELAQLNALERLALRWRALQRFMVDRHARAFRKLLAGLPPLRRVTIIGGGLFPRTTLVLRQLIPAAEITIIDRSKANLARARTFLDGTVRVVEASYAPELCRDAELLVVPLAFSGDRLAFYAQPPAPVIAVHDWIWRRRGEGVVVSFLLLKRINLVRR
jgi:hypothetical protein